ncbi:helix-turn-helix domain-containing protein [Mesorhizobium sp. A556]
MATSKPFTLPEAVLNAITAGVHVARAYREHLGYTIGDVAITSGLTVQEVEQIEAGHRFEKGYRDRIARALSLPEGVFDAEADIANAA